MVEQTLAPVTKTNGTGQSWDPFQMLQTLQYEMENLWRRPFFFGAGTWPTIFPPMKASGTTFIPRTDMYERGDMLVFKVEMPRIAKEDVSIEFYEGDLVIKGEAKAEKEVAEAAYYRRERTHGSFYRRLPLPFEVKPEHIKATPTDGVLEIQIPKPVATKPEATKTPVA